MSLAQYLKSFSNLRTYKDQKKWSALTAFQAIRSHTRLQLNMPGNPQT
jgi:hypothetical protein